MFWSRRAGTLVGFLCWGLVCSLPLRAEVDPASRLPPGFQQRTFASESGVSRYIVSLPPDYDPSRRWPVMLFLHGAGERGRDGWMPISLGPAVALEQSPQPFVSVFPQCEDVDGRSRGGWLAGTPDADRALAILTDVEQRFSIDPDRRILVGWSMGGYGAWSLAAQDPEKWSAVLAISGGETGESLSLDRLAAAGTPVWAIHGGRDALVSSEQSRELIRRLNAAGGNGGLTLLDKAGHDVWRKAFASRNLFRWLLDPQSDRPSAKELARQEPLPPHSQFFYDALSHVEVIPEALAIRLGNDALAKLSPEIPELIPPETLEGRLDDIRRTLDNGDDPIQVLLSEVTYRCHVDNCSLKAISGGRLKVRFSFHPLVLRIERTELTSRAHQASAGPVSIEIGNARPVVLELEVQPVIRDGAFHLRKLRENFLLDRGNWYVRPPQTVSVRSREFTRRHVVTGIVGSLYRSRDDVVEQVLQVVPDLLHRVEIELQRHEAPRLAQLLSPLPAVIPELDVRVSRVQTDSAGLSLAFDLLVVDRGSAAVERLESFPSPDAGGGRDLAVCLAWPAFSAISRLHVARGGARINVRDVEDPGFERLADPAAMSRVLPGLVDRSPLPKLRVLISLLQPLAVTPAAAGENGADEALLTLWAERAALDVWEETDGGRLTPLARLPFSLAQPLLVAPSRSSGRDAAAMHVRWLSQCDVEFLGVEPLEGVQPDVVNDEALEGLLRDAWLSWSGQHGSRDVPLENARIGNAQLVLDQVQIRQGCLGLSFACHRLDESSRN